MQGFEAVAQELEQKRHHLEQELAAVRGRASEIEADLERVHEAMAALSGHKKRSKGRARAKKTVPTVHELQQHIAKVREESPFADAGALEQAVRELAKSSGASLTGFKTTFAKALLSSPGYDAGASAHYAHHEAPPHETVDSVVGDDHTQEP